VHFLQIWIVPDTVGLAPGYEQKAFPAAERQGKLRLVASPDGRDGSLTLHQDVDLYATSLAAGQTLGVALRPLRHAWLQVARGTVRLDGTVLAAGDGAAVLDQGALQLASEGGGEILLFDLA
jgi:hypothetical protein